MSPPRNTIVRRPPWQGSKVATFLFLLLLLVKLWGQKNHSFIFTKTPPKIKSMPQGTHVYIGKATINLIFLGIFATLIDARAFGYFFCTNRELGNSKKTP